MNRINEKKFEHDKNAFLKISCKFIEFRENIFLQEIYLFRKSPTKSRFGSNPACSLDRRSDELI